MELFNAITASLLFLVGLYWVRRWIKIPSYLLFSSAILLLIHGLGGTVFHATGSSQAFWLLDVLPIDGSLLAVALFFWVKLTKDIGKVLLILSAAAGLQIGIPLIVPGQVGVGIAFLSSALFILVPIGVLLYQSRYKDISIVALSLICFAVGFCFRAADSWSQIYIPVGTHWIWHIFAAAAIGYLFAYADSIQRST